MFIKVGNAYSRFNPACIWQGDPYVKNELLGYGPYTIGASGCGLACMLGIFNLYCNANLDLKFFNNLVKDYNGFDEKSHIKWDTIKHFVNSIDRTISRTYGTVSADLSQLRFPCIVRVDYNTSNDMDDWHYVVALEDRGNDIFIADPINGKTYGLLTEYGFPKGGLKRAIYQIIRYE